MMLSDSLIGVVSQTLCKRRSAAAASPRTEVLIVTSAVANLIREEKTFQIVSIMQTSKAIGMVTLNESLLTLVRNGLVEPDEAYAQAVGKRELAMMLGRAGFKGAFSEESG
jgi:twitching motility protein PilT